MSDTERIEEIREAWEHDMRHPYRVAPTNGGYVGWYIDGRRETRTEWEARSNPFRVMGAKSDERNIGFLLSQLDAAQAEIQRLKERNKRLHDEIKRATECGGLVYTGLAEAEQENEKLREAIEWFMSTSHISADVHSSMITVVDQAEVYKRFTEALSAVGMQS